MNKVKKKSICKCGCGEPTSGGDWKRGHCNRNISDITREKLSSARKMRVTKPETREKIAIASSREIKGG